MIYDSPKVTIICPLYNKERYIEATIKSVISQTWDCWELIIVDDGSSDRSLEIVSDYIDSKIKLFYRKDFTAVKGGSVCRNIGIQKATGSHVIFLDADDILAENCVEKRLSIVDEFPHYGFYIFNIVHFENDVDNLKQKKTKFYSDKIRYILSGNKRDLFLRRFLKYDSPWSICNTLWDVTALKQIGGFNESFQRLQDPEIHTRALLEDSISFKILKYKIEPDVFVRADIDRKSNFNDIQIFDNVLLSIEHFVGFFADYLIKHDRQEYLKCLSSYMFLTEQMFFGYSRGAKSKCELKTYQERYNTLHKQPFLQLVVNPRYFRYLRLYKFLRRFRFARKLRLHSLIVYFYKLTT